MADNAAYNPTTESLANKAPKHCSSELERINLILKVAQLVLSLVAFICEEVIDQCDSCGGLYFFEFVSCSAVLLAILMLVVYCSPLRRKIIIPSFKKIDFYVTATVGIIFLIASITFVSTMDAASSIGKVSVAFGFLASFAFLIELLFMYKSGYLTTRQTPTPGANGTVEREPLNMPIQVSA